MKACLFASICHPRSWDRRLSLGINLPPRRKIEHHLFPQNHSWHCRPTLKVARINGRNRNTALHAPLPAPISSTASCPPQALVALSSEHSEEYHAEVGCIIGGNCHKYLLLFSRQKFCRDKHVFVVTKQLFVVTKHVFCRGKSMLVAAKLLSWQTCVRGDKHNVVTKNVLPRFDVFCREKMILPPMIRVGAELSQSCYPFPLVGNCVCFCCCFFVFV